jgi:hypothetical protein
MKNGCGHGAEILWPPQERLLADLRTVFFGKIEIAEWTVKIHPRS